MGERQGASPLPSLCKLQPQGPLLMESLSHSATESWNHGITELQSHGITESKNPRMVYVVRHPKASPFQHSCHGHGHLPLSLPAVSARAPGVLRLRFFKLPVNPRSPENDQTQCSQAEFVPAAQLATPKLRINCKPLETPGKPKINTAKAKHFPLKSHGQGKALLGWLPRDGLGSFIVPLVQISLFG